MNFPWNKNKKKADLDMEMLRHSRVPILILDKVWHNIFPPEKKTKTIRDLEERLGNLLKQQGQLNNDLKDYLKLKKKLMDGILELTTEAFNNENEAAKKEMEKNQKYILEINEKIEEIQNRLATIPEEIQEVNGKLLEESVKICYGEMKEHQKALEELNEWIEKTRELLKAKLEEKTIHEEKASQIYSYLHDLVGADFIDYLDKNYWR
ncbi:MAG: hypothetical protein PWP07_1129 [Epulopiscium sp.]|jgi:DNA repair exonuclease SbcCD ATPase subunit|uniref:Uncharacterized protein n=1 Tax=Defluviitalea raffinosedens TaxID=1450156 RepID=A0A7C8HF08_9FIRM|nr:hypothetical protein [Defluviitalea raffinosedens]MBZ4668788.1 hypothetical protein [Defluviitaleaceae bacterium]MDK2787904.1 hypothetical protein [Candidatus Epulonipiscium sp.]KAE9635402.1 hypothetical protein GND95_04445 [Defluviitalea raffinosedens]MBM7684305.1 peptidoglycan hydrolase CwlO-like protein [Defluviitalea raffinosedens]HHW67581.1 hypothetical protein [Candidatus Epulonipiscium sp.]